MSKILIIEDERDIEEFLRFFLEDSGYEVAVARDGLEGITAFQKRQIRFNPAGYYAA